MDIGVVGLGLIGGSVAKALKARANHRVWGIDADEAVQAEAERRGAVDGPLTEMKLRGCGLVIVALYPGAALHWVLSHRDRFVRNSVVVDCCGVKRALCQPLYRAAREHGFTFIGGHPMAGTERSGFGAARADLFAGASMILVPEEDTPVWALDRAQEAFLAMGFGRVQLATPEEHDSMIAYTSQLAHVVSCAYVDNPLAFAVPGFCAGSFLDMTRVARLNANMWTELFLANGDYLADEIQGLARRLERYAAALREGDKQAIAAMLARSTETKEQVDALLAAGKRGQP